ncbi:SigE family RNA polymerase sigma factor [Streptomyces sp. AC627_RSS907]|uniref:SigE family RNA polymerase sigma factor n=1 Tax=Streptomyces sp. AC627_RSS907 TaxID=2823684 RepID=UPI0027E4417E|nr:SigE family RNA polymerase sigma factor [Streptomyces sp. AC627_RSS907]
MRLKKETVDLSFEDFARSVQPRLRRTAFVLSGDWHLAEDLTQTCLAKVFAAWGRVSRMESPDAYARRVLYRSFVDETRRSRWREWLGASAEVPERPSAESDPVLRMTLVQALGQLSAGRRAVLVLRFWEDLSVDQTAEVLGCTAGTVKSQTARGLSSMRRLLGGTALEEASAHGAGARGRWEW